MAEFAIEAIDASFTAFGRPAIYATPGGSPTQPCTIIRQIPTQGAAFGAGRPEMEGVSFEVRAGEIPAPAMGGTFVVSGITYQIIRGPEFMDPEQLVWVCPVATV